MLVQERRRAAGLLAETSIEDAAPSAWSQTEWLLVHLHDKLTILAYLVEKANFKPGPQPPKFLPRPGTEKPRRRTLGAWFGAVGLGPLERPARTT